MRWFGIRLQSDFNRGTESRQVHQRAILGLSGPSKLKMRPQKGHNLQAPARKELVVPTEIN